MWKQAPYNLLDSIRIIQAQGLASSQQSHGDHFGPFVLLNNKEHIGPPLPGSLHHEVAVILPPSEVELQELQFLPLNRASHGRNQGT